MIKFKKNISSLKKRKEKREQILNLGKSFKLATR
jgi:hypothetical protein